MKKFLVFLLFAVFLTGCPEYVRYDPLEKENCVFIGYPEKELVLVFSWHSELKKTPFMLETLGYQKNDLTFILIGDSVSVLDKINVKPEILYQQGQTLNCEKIS